MRKHLGETVLGDCFVASAQSRSYLRNHHRTLKMIQFSVSCFFA